ncbi:hypothetical protein F2Q70_00031572 [Brassica cretica]|uniref:UspA domain-containing protein n=1 Tax=Brassica cretica TaxID=69181 RepID=A0A8S9FKW7_BRACR|nr:hypothetical protein F2Q70_00031572 [Brassica cretica]
MQRRINEIEEEEEEGYGRTSLETVRESPFEGSSGTVSLSGEDNVYVGVGKGDSSIGALRWALDNLIPSSSTLLFLIHVFPETHFIPYPLGRLAREQASEEQLDAFMSQEREKRRTLLNKFIQTCSASKVPSLSFSLSWNSFKSSKLTDERLSQKQVKVETILVESDSVAKAIQDLTTILNIKKLVLGIDKSNARKAKSLKGNSVAEQIMRSSAAETCEVKVICQGKEIEIEKPATDRSPSKPSIQLQPKKDQSSDSFAWFCLSKPKTIS